MGGFGLDFAVQEHSDRNKLWTDKLYILGLNYKFYDIPKINE